MGITGWQLYRPEVLQGVVEVQVAPAIRLIVIADEIPTNSPLFRDLLLSLELKKEECLCVNFDQAQHLETAHAVRYWLLSENNEKIDRTLPYCHQAERIYRSPNWAIFQTRPDAKRAFWRQVQQG